jgi:hypothetical protein
VASWYALTTHTADDGEAPKWRVMSGSARLTMVLSRTDSEMPRRMAAIAQ